MNVYNDNNIINNNNNNNNNNKIIIIIIIIKRITTVFNMDNLVLSEFGKSENSITRSFKLQSRP